LKLKDKISNLILKVFAIWPICFNNTIYFVYFGM